MNFGPFVLTPLIGFCLLQAQTAPQQPAPSPMQGARFESVPEPRESPPAESSGPSIEAIEFRGARRASPSALRAIIASRPGGVCNFETLRRDSQALYNTGGFSNVAWETEPGPAGIIVRFVLVERPLIQAIIYQGDGAVTMTEILERFEQRKIRLRVETLYNDEELVRAAAAIQELAVEKGRRNITVTPIAESLWPHSTVSITFRVDEK